jgi:hypothetical protein
MKSLILLRDHLRDRRDYQRGDEILGAMPAGDTPGRRTSVKKYSVGVRTKS